MATDRSFLSRPTQRRRQLCVAAASVVALLLGGCDADDVSDHEAPLAPGESLGELRQQAGRALDRYDKTVAGAGPSTPAEAGPPPGLAIEAARGAPTATQLTVTFTGARGPATEPCGADYYAEAVESARAVVVIVIAQPHAANEMCTLEGYTRTATANLARPLGRRAVLDVREGQRVPVERALITK